MKSPLTIPLVLVAAICGYGFLASTEPGAQNFYFRLGYAAVGLLCLVAAAVGAARGK